MKVLFDTIGKVTASLAALAKIMIGLMIVLIVVDVARRNLGMRPIPWAVSVSEYALLYITFLPMPWLVRIKGHVFVEFLRNYVPPAGRKILERIVYLTSAAVCFYLAYHAIGSMVDNYISGAYQTRTFDMPKWLIFLPMVIGLVLSGLEWLRFLVGLDSLYKRDPLEIEGL